MCVCADGMMDGMIDGWMDGWCRGLWQWCCVCVAVGGGGVQ